MPESIISTNLLLQIVQNNENQIGLRFANVFCDLVEDLSKLERNIQQKGKFDKVSPRIIFKIRGKIHEKYAARLQIEKLPEVVCYKDKEYNLRKITMNYLDLILDLENKLEATS